MYEPKTFAKALIEFARETLEDISSAERPSATQLRTLDAISLVLDKQLHRNQENELIASLALTDLFGAEMEATKDDAKELKQKLRDMATAIQIGSRIMEG